MALLGRLTASSGGTPLDLGGPRQRAVLALLLLARGEVVPAERLAESLWPEDAPADTAGALQAYVSHLRRRLQPGSAARTRSAVIVREGRGYAVRLPDDAVDAWRFERLLEEAAGEDRPARAAELLREALALWRGPALADYVDAPWAEAETARLTELRAVARERLAAARLELGEAALCVADLEAMVAEEPLREERWRLLVLALCRAHRQADALSALRRARRTLADELGVDPGPALRALEEQVLAQSPELRVPAPRAPVSSPARPGPEHPPSPAGATPDDLLDRDRELTALRSALDDLAAGEPRLLLIEGPPGIGKSRLLTEARRLASARSVRVLTARGSQLETAFGFGAVRQLFEPGTHRPGAAGGAAAWGRGRCTECLRPGLRRGARGVLRRPARSLLAHGRPRGGRARPPRRRRPAVVRQRLTALPGLPRATPGRGAGARGRDRAHRRGARRRGVAGRAVPRTGDGRDPARAAVPGGHGRHGGAPARGAGVPLVRRSLLPDDVGEPPAAAAAAAGSRGRRRAARRRARRHGRRRRLPGGVQHGPHAAAPARRVGPGGRPGRRRPGGWRGPAGRGHARRAARGGHRHGSGHPRPRRDRQGRAAAGLRAPAGPGGGVPRPARRRAGTAARARGAGAAVVGRDRRAGRRPPAAGAAARRRGDGRRPAAGGAHSRRSRRLRQRGHPAAACTGRAAVGGPAARPAPGAGAAGVPPRRRRQRPAPPAGLRAAGRSPHPGRPRCGDRTHARLRQRTRHRDRLRTGGPACGARRTPRPPAGAAGHRADQRLHARPGPGDLADGSAAGSGGGG
ncbi:BTAD domain-containing putative transcriptional regulator [Geodermatophilus obscurus]|uniref:BTAD domain-containing putative transcriptional regulator n=1 Tax=Geodermatophilus obscurus TaxID=1861 RepID=UPI003C7C3F2F